MKPYYIFISCAALLLACKKQTSGADKIPVVQRTLYVKEAETKIPISKARVNVYVCLRPIGWGGCDQGYAINIVSDASGNCSYRIESGDTNHISSMSVDHEQYWGITDGSGWGVPSIPREGEIFLYPKTTLAISVQKKNTTSVEKLNIMFGDSSSVVDYFDAFNNNHPAYFISTDTTLYNQISGNHLYFLRWSANSQDSTITFKGFRFDTARVTININ